MSRLSVMASMDAADALEGEGAVADAAASQRQQQQQQQAGARGAAEGDVDVPCGDGPLEFSTDTWTAELADFVQQVVGQPAYVAGNSLGGYLAVSLAASHPALVKGLVLLNATPFWSFRPPKGQPQGIWSFLPPPAVPVPPGLKRTVERIWWNQLRSRATVNSMLGMVYVHKPVVTHDTSVAERIIGATEHPAALDAFVSIVSAHKPRDEFEQMLAASRCPVCLVYGRQDPWVVPVWGQRAKHVLTKCGRPPPLYLEVDGAGHCPHHEAPRATNLAITSCLQQMERMGAQAPAPAATAPTTQALGSPAPAGQQPAAAAAGTAAPFIGHDDHQPGDEVVRGPAGAQEEVLLPLLAVGERFEVQEDEDEEEEEVAASPAGAVQAEVGGAAVTAQAEGAAAAPEGGEQGGGVVAVRRRRRRTVVLEHVDGRPRILPERVSHFIWRWLERGGSGGSATTATVSANAGGDGSGVGAAGGSS